MTAWFKPRRYGYGATPVTWQGWSVIGAFLVGIAVLMWATIGFHHEGRSVGDYAIYFVGAAVLVAALWIISRRTTAGEWRWRWGDKEQERQ